MSMLVKGDIEIQQLKEVKMRKRVILERIQDEIELLSPQEQLKLIENLSRQLRKVMLTVKREYDWNQLYGLGKGLWNGEDAQEYVDRLREDRI